MSSVGQAAQAAVVLVKGNERISRRKIVQAAEKVLTIHRGDDVDVGGNPAQFPSVQEERGSALEKEGNPGAGKPSEQLEGMQASLQELQLTDFQ
jgi:hypothetical protein